MKAHVIRTSVLLLPLILGRGSVRADFLPGTPLSGGTFPTVDLFDGTQMLPGPVTPGDLVIQEALPIPSPTDRTRWSDVVRFFNAPDASGTQQGFALLASDGETGVGNIGLRLITLPFQGAQTGFDLPDSLAANTTFYPVVEPSDPTPYQVPGGLYNVHSDVNEIEPTPPPKQPGALQPLAGQPANLVVILGENSNAFDPNGGGVPIVVNTNLPLFPGNNNVFDSDGTLSDILNFNAAGQVQLTFSDILPGAGEEELPLVVLDEGTSATYMVPDLAEVPEPSALLLTSLGIVGLLGYAGCRGWHAHAA